MPDFPMIGASRFETGAHATEAGGVVLTAGGSAHTKAASYTTIIASSSFDARLMVVQLGWWGGGAVDFLVDIAVGAASSEVIIANNLHFSSGTGDYCTQFEFPIFVPAGTRISARCQATTASRTLRCAVTLGTHGFLPSSPLSVITTYGANTADSGGVQVDPGGTIETKGAYSEITSSLTFDISYFVLAVGIQNNTVRTSARFLMDIAVGAAGSEVILLPDQFYVCASTGDCLLPASICWPCSIPAGTRVAARAACSINDAADRLFDVVLYGVS